MMESLKRKRRRRKMINERTIIFLLFLTLIGMGLAGCNKTNICPDTTTLEIGETSNGKEKNTKSIKQSFKWGKTKCQDR